MSVVIALLRAVNVGGRSLKMADLVRFAADFGLAQPRTLLQTGNLVFETALAADAALESRLEVAAEARFGFPIDFVLRSADGWGELVARNPFPHEAADDPGHLVAMPLKAPPAEGGLGTLRAAIAGRERVALIGRDAYLVYPDGIGASKLTIQVIERRLGARGTGRNWNTVLKLARMAGG